MNICVAEATHFTRQLWPATFSEKWWPSNPFFHWPVLRGCGNQSALNFLLKVIWVTQIIETADEMSDSAHVCFLVPVNVNQTSMNINERNFFQWRVIALLSDPLQDYCSLAKHHKAKIHWLEGSTSTAILSTPGFDTTKTVLFLERLSPEHSVCF